MNFGNIKKMIRTMVSTAKINKVGSPILELAINEGALDVARKMVCLPKTDTFDSVADQGTYDLTSILTRYLTMGKSGIWYRTSDSTNYYKLFPRTMKYMDENKPDWRDFESGDPVEYVVHGDSVIFPVAPDTAITKAFWIEYGQAPQAMTNNEHFPFGLETEIHRLRSLSMAVMKFAEIFLVKALNKGLDNYRIKENEYKRELAEQKLLLDERKDISSDRETKMRPRRIYSGF